MAVFTLTSHASVTLKFNSDLQGFGDGGGGGSFGWSPVNGGSLALTIPGGTHSDMVVVNLANDPALWAELNQTEANGGFLSFDVIVRTSDQVYTSGDAAAAVQVIVSGNSAAGGWVGNNVANTTLPVGGSGVVTKHVILPIKTGGATGGGNFVVSGGWALLGFGLQGLSSVTSATVYIDNIRFLALPSPASVTLSFDSGLQGFGNGGGGGTYGWSSVNGGSMALTNSGGYHASMVNLNMGNNPALWRELQLAEANGGFLSFDVVIRTNDQVYTSGDAGAAVQVNVVCNSDTGGYIDNNAAYTALPVTGEQKTTHVLMPITTNGTAGSGNFVVSGTWALLQFGLQAFSTVTSATVYIDNIKILAFPSATADVTFDTYFEGFNGTGNGGTFSWSSGNGGSMMLANSPGYHNDMVALGLGNYPALWAKLNNSEANGGTLTFDEIIQTSDQTYTAGGNAWIQLIVVGNSDLGGYKDNNLATTTLPVGGGVKTNHIVLPITTTGTSGGGTFVASGAWANLQLGLQNGSGVSTGAVYIDNIRIIPEPPPLPSTQITSTIGGGSLTLDWPADGYKLQTAPSLNPSAWADYPWPDGITPPVAVPINPANAAAFYRLAPQ